MTKNGNQMDHWLWVQTESFKVTRAFVEAEMRFGSLTLNAQNARDITWVNAGLEFATNVE